MNSRSWKIVRDGVCRRLITRIERSNGDSSSERNATKKYAIASTFLRLAATCDAILSRSSRITTLRISCLFDANFDANAKHSIRRISVN